MKNNFKVIFSIILFCGVILSCSKFNFSFGNEKTNKLYFCEKYDFDQDECEGKSSKYSTGNLTVMVDLRPAKKTIKTDKVNINITNLKSGEVYETYPYDTREDMDYIYFENVNFKTPGKFKVSALMPDGTVIASNEIEISGE